MYEPIRSKSVHTMAAAPADFPHRTREEELDIQLAGHLSALLAVVDEIRALTPSAGLDTAAKRLAEQLARLDGARAAARTAAPSPLPAAPAPRREADTASVPADRAAELHARAHALAGRALVVAASRADTAAAILAAECMDLHAAAARNATGQVAASA